jgi:hypothetical protein
MTLRVLDPRVDADEGAFRVASPLPSLKGAAVGMIDNAKIGTEKLFDAIAAILKTEYGVREFLRVRKPDATKPVPAPMLASIAGADAIIAGVGD